jgi:hypothetical protein
VGGGAWPFLVGGVICLVNSDNERDSSLLNKWRGFLLGVPPVGGVSASPAGSQDARSRLLRGTGGDSTARNRAITGL